MLGKNDLVDNLSRDLDFDRMTDATAHPDDQANRKHHLLKGPEEFREARVDRPKAKK